VQRFCSVFHQILTLIPRAEFQQLVDRHGSDRRSKGFSSWSQFVAMIFCQLGRAQSLREIEQGLASAGHSAHLQRNEKLMQALATTWYLDSRSVTRGEACTSNHPRRIFVGMNWRDLWRQVFLLSTRSRIGVEDRYRMKRLVRQLKREDERKAPGRKIDKSK
jgi:hypothetical protein